MSVCVCVCVVCVCVCVCVCVVSECVYECTGFWFTGTICLMTWV